MKYYLIDNVLTEDPNDLRPVTVEQKVNTEKEIIKMILYRCAGLTESQIASVLKEERAAIEQMLERGEGVATDLFSIKPRISGVFYSKTEAFDRSKHQIRLKMQPGASLLKTTEAITVERVEKAKLAPILSYFVDYATNTKNEQLTPGQMARIYGERLKFDPADAAQGIFFISNKDIETKVVTVADNLPKSLTFNVPVLAKGTYRLVVRANHKMKQVRSGELEDVLTVA